MSKEFESPELLAGWPGLRQKGGETATITEGGERSKLSGQYVPSIEITLCINSSCKPLLFDRETNLFRREQLSVKGKRIDSHSFSMHFSSCFNKCFKTRKITHGTNDRLHMYGPFQRDSAPIRLNGVESQSVCEAVTEDLQTEQVRAMATFPQSPCGLSQMNLERLKVAPLAKCPQNKVPKLVSTHWTNSNAGLFRPDMSVKWTDLSQAILRRDTERARER